MAQKIEVFSAGCAVCQETVEMVRRIAGTSHTIVKNKIRARQNTVAPGAGFTELPVRSARHAARRCRRQGEAVWRSAGAERGYRRPIGKLLHGPCSGRSNFANRHSTPPNILFGKVGRNACPRGKIRSAKPISRCSPLIVGPCRRRRSRERRG